MSCPNGKFFREEKIIAQYNLPSFSAEKS